ncbi:MAG: cobalamin biosynthesis protein CbiG [Alphaproteobacteria bacterium]
MGEAARALFDAYVMVDWSARSTRATGADSIWWALVERLNGRPRLVRRENPPYRAEATETLGEVLCGLADAGRRVLVGFDFPFGYPRGFARRLGLDAGAAAPAWRAIWELLANRVEDGPYNENNRFTLAAELNGPGDFPFWGHPHQWCFDGLKPTKPRRYGDDTLPERRYVELRVPRTKPLWQLTGNGSVGSQALLGIPRVRELRLHPDLADRTVIWPFETGLDVPRVEAGVVVLAEVYPSLVRERRERRQVKDACQVRTVAELFAALDAREALAPLFAGDPGLDPVVRRCVETEEAWILGVTDRAPGFDADTAHA